MPPHISPMRDGTFSDPNCAFMGVERRRRSGADRISGLRNPSRYAESRYSRLSLPTVSRAKRICLPKLLRRLVSDFRAEFRWTIFSTGFLGAVSVRCSSQCGTKWRIRSKPPIRCRNAIFYAEGAPKNVKRAPEAPNRKF